MKKNLRDAILWYAIQNDGDWKQIAYCLQVKAPYKKVEYAYPFVTLADKEYPRCFLQLRYPPWILFYQGKLSYLSQKCVGIIGARDCTDQALKNTREVVNVLKKKYVIVSGLAKGIDAMAHKSALDQKTIGIIGCGIDRIYPKENQDLYQIMAKQHLILSEYPMQTAPKAHHFPWRNRLIAACSSSIVVIQARCKSGTMHTVNECLELSKPVYCLPSAYEDKVYQGCNVLIQNGALSVVQEQDLYEI